MKLSTLSNFPANLILYWFAWGQILWLSLISKHWGVKNRKHAKTDYLTPSSKLDADINGTTMDQREKIPRKTKDSKSHSSTEVLEKPKLNAAAV